MAGMDDPMGGGGGMDPFMQGLLSIFAANNPGVAGATLDQAGIPPPQGMMQPSSGDMGDMMNPTNAQKPQNPNLAGLAGMAGVVAPKPITPIMNGGVTGGVKPPDVNVAGMNSAQSPGLMALLATMLGGSGPGGLRTPSLGGMINGKGY